MVVRVSFDDVFRPSRSTTPTQPQSYLRRWAAKIWRNQLSNRDRNCCLGFSPGGNLRRVFKFIDVHYDHVEPLHPTVEWLLRLHGHWSIESFGYDGRDCSFARTKRIIDVTQRPFHLRLPVRWSCTVPEHLRPVEETGNEPRKCLEQPCRVACRYDNWRCVASQSMWTTCCNQRLRHSGEIQDEPHHNPSFSLVSSKRV